MAEQYQVVGALADFTVSDDEGNAQKITFYKGSVVPPGVPQNELDHNLSVRLIAPMGSPEEAVPAMTGPLGDGQTRAPEGNALAEPVPVQSAPVAVSPMVATDEQVQAGTVVATEQSTGGTSDAERQAAQQKLAALNGEAPDGRHSKAVHVEYLVTQGYSYDEVSKLDSAAVKDMTKQVSQS